MATARTAHSRSFRGFGLAQASHSTAQRRARRLPRWQATLQPTPTPLAGAELPATVVVVVVPAAAETVVVVVVVINHPNSVARRQLLLRQWPGHPRRPGPRGGGTTSTQKRTAQHHNSSNSSQDRAALAQAWVGPGVLPKVGVLVALSSLLVHHQRLASVESVMVLVLVLGLPL